MRRSSHRWRRWPARPDDVRDDSRKRRAGVRPFPGLAAASGRDLGVRSARPPTPDAAAAAAQDVGALQRLREVPEDVVDHDDALGRVTGAGGVFFLITGSKIEVSV